MYTRLCRSLPLISLVALGGCKAALLHPQGQIGLSERNLILIALVLMLLVVVPVIVMAVVFSIRYRASNDKATYTPDWDNSHKIETVVWGVPCLIVFILSVICWQSTHALDPAKPIQSTATPIIIDVVALDWKWLFIYPEQQIASVNEVAFPVDVPVHFVITSDTVMNSFFIPQLGSQIYAMAGMKANLNLIANAKGNYDGMSANFSGEGFSGMKFQAVVTSQADFEKWVAAVRHTPDPLNTVTYAELAKPSEDNPVLHYATVAPTLFDGIIDKYMGMDMLKDAPPTPKMTTGTRMDAPGEENVK